MEILITADRLTLHGWSERSSVISKFMKRYAGTGHEEEPVEGRIRWTLKIKGDKADKAALEMMKETDGIEVWMDY